MMMSEMAAAVMEPFWTAELDYRRERAMNAYPRGPRAPRRRLRLRRRPTLKLPQQRRRPVAVA